METRYEAQDAGLEWLFAQARRYPLLEAIEEADIDAAKWAAIAHLQALFLEDAAARHYLSTLVRQLLADPPDAQRIAVRQHARLLRRELGDYLPGKARHGAAQRFLAALDGGAPTSPASLAALHLPAALVAGIGEVLTDATDRRGVAAALAYWASTWGDGAASGADRSSVPTRQEMVRQLGVYHRARGKLVNHNLRLVFAIAGRFSGRAMPFRDLVQEGVFGLLRAAEKYRADSGNRFSTYAYNWVLQSMRRALMDQEGVVRLPAQVTEQVSRVYRERLRHLGSTGAEPGTALLAERLGMDIEAVEELLQLGNLGLSLETPRHAGDDELTLGATLTGGPFGAVSEAAQQHSLRRFLADHLEQLSAVEQRVVTRRWGVDGAPPESRSDLAAQLGVSAERVRQIEANALDKLRGDADLLAAYEAQQTDLEH